MLYARGIILERLDRFAEAEKDLRHVIKLRPESAAAYNALGYGLADRNQRLPEARELVLKALELNPNSSAIQDSMAWVEYRLGNLSKARAILAQVFEADPEAEIAAHYGEVLWKSGERESARKVWQQGLEIDPQDKVLLETIRRLEAQP